MEVNKHHLYWTRKSWESYGLSKQIRNHELSIQPMVIPIHNELHAYVEPIKPPTSASMARMVLGNILELPSSYTALDAAKSLRDDLYDTEAQYISDHLNRQIPFLELSARALKQRRV